jgi:hypothetical protein
VKMSATIAIALRRSSVKVARRLGKNHDGVKLFVSSGLWPIQGHQVCPLSSVLFQHGNCILVGSLYASIVHGIAINLGI